VEWRKHVRNVHKMDPDVVFQSCPRPELTKGEWNAVIETPTSKPTDEPTSSSSEPLPLVVDSSTTATCGKITSCLSLSVVPSDEVDRTNFSLNVSGLGEDDEVAREKTEPVDPVPDAPDRAEETTPDQVQDVLRKPCPICGTSVTQVSRHIKRFHNVDPRTVLPSKVRIVRSWFTDKKTFSCGYQNERLFPCPPTA
jgi:hypothetical protein